MRQPSTDEMFGQSEQSESYTKEGDAQCNRCRTVGGFWVMMRSNLTRSLRRVLSWLLVITSIMLNGTEFLLQMSNLWASFRCAKCDKQVNHNSNLLLLGDGFPVCEDCSYSCKVCGNRIDDLAIMTGVFCLVY